MINIAYSITLLLFMLNYNEAITNMEHYASSFHNDSSITCISHTPQYILPQLSHIL